MGAIAKQTKLSVGDRFGKLTIVKIFYERKKLSEGRLSRRPTTVLICKCDCGKEIEKTRKELHGGKLMSCGCYIGDKNRRYFTTHGVRHEPEYYVWSSMKGRCYNPNNVNYKNYGGRGIYIGREWINDAGAFVKWAKDNGWKKGLDIDRINNNGNYEPSNCRIVTRKVNSNNRRNSKMYLYNQKEKTLAEWSQEIGIKYNTLRHRVLHNWSFKEAIEKPSEGYRGGKKPKKLPLNGELKTLSDWCNQYGVALTTVRYRLKLGWGLEESLTTPLMHKKLGTR